MSDGGLHKEFRKHLPLAHWQRLESGLTGGGIPDLNGCRDGVDIWIENKAVIGWILPKGNLRPAQVAWAEARLRHGGRCFVAIRQRGLQRDDLWLFSGWGLRTLHQGLRFDRADHLLGRWPGGPAKWGWSEVNFLLFG